MNYIEFHRSGVEISAVSFGGMPLSIKGRPSEEEARAVLRAVLDGGVNFIDTADVYCLDDEDLGHNERLIASVLRWRDDRERIHVATKGGMRRPKGAWVNDATPNRLRLACENSLRALGVDQIFLYQLHAPDPNFMFEKSVETLARLQDEQKIRFVGLSNVSVEQIDAASTIVEVASVQNRLNPFFREAIDTGVVEECESRRITFLAYSPLGGGRLSRKLPEHPVLRDVAAEADVSPEQATLAWVRSRGKTVVPIPGASTTGHALDSIAASEIELSREHLQRISDSSFDRS